TRRSARQDLEELSRTLEKTDLAVRSLRVIARRVITVIDELDSRATAVDDLERLSAWFSEAADAVAVLGRSAAEPSSVGRHKSLSIARRSEEHTSELQSCFELVCRLLLEKKNQKALVIHLPPPNHYRFALSMIRCAHGFPSLDLS